MIHDSITSEASKAGVSDGWSDRVEITYKQNLRQESDGVRASGDICVLKLRIRLSRVQHVEHSNY